MSPTRAPVGARRSTATQRRAQAVAAGLRVFADHGPTTGAVQLIADEIGVSQSYVFRLFGSKQAFFSACLDEVEARVREVFRQAAQGSPEQPLPMMAAGFRELISDGVITGFWLQACAMARADEAVAARCRSLVAGVMAEAEQQTGAPLEDLARFTANGALVMMLQALGVDPTGGSRAALGSLRTERRER